jgi:hypothetical protein
MSGISFFVALHVCHINVTAKDSAYQHLILFFAVSL